MISQEMKDLLGFYDQGLKLYKEAKFEEALDSFKKGLEKKPGDGPSEMYIKRCKEFIQTPPPKDWDGVYVMKTK